MRCPNCQTINPPEAKFCLECGNRLVVCPNCGTINLPTAKFCIECGTPLRQGVARSAQPVPVSPVPTPSASTNQTSPLLDAINAPEERRVVTIMFADITGSTQLADHMDPEDMRAILTGYFNLMTEQIRRHGGTVEKYIGDAVMAVFGSPITHEDDPDRAIRAALDMQKALADFNQQRQVRDPEATRLQMRIGINTGEVATPSHVRSSQRDFLITGDAVNVAARLQQSASPDNILVGERTYLTTRDVFDFQTVAPLRVKGKTAPIRAWVVFGLHNRTATITQHPRGIDGLQARFVGRDLELALMHATYARVQAERRPHLITLLGSPGIGKSRLVREFIESEQTAAQCASCSGQLVAPKVLYGRCPPYGEGITYWPLVEIIRSLLQVRDEEIYDVLRDRLIEFVRETLANAKSTEDPLQVAIAITRSVGRSTASKAFGQSYIETRERERQRSTLSKNSEQPGAQMELMRAWRVLLEALAQQQPLTVIVDDLQWADEALLDLLEYLTDRINDVPILFLCPVRPDFFERRRDWGGGRRNFTTIALEALSNEESSELVDALLNSEELPGVLRYTILNRAEGNPFFVEEIVRMLIDQGVLLYENGCWHVGKANEDVLNELASPATPPNDTLIDLHYVFPLPRVPDTIQGVLAARVDLLNQTEKRVLQHASIIGRTFWLSALLELASDLSATFILETLNLLIQRDFIVESEQRGRSFVEHDRVFSFKHVLIRDVVYNNVPRIRRSQEHARLAFWLEKQTEGHTELFAELLSYHYQQALATWSAALAPDAIDGSTGDNHDSSANLIRFTRPELRSRAIKYTTMAGDQALHSYFTIRAIQAYSEALDLLIDSSADAPTLARMHEKLGDAYTQRANLDEAWQEYRKALQLFTSEPDKDNDALLCLYERLAELGSRWLGLFTINPDMQEVRTYIDDGLKMLEGRETSGAYAAFLTYRAFWYVLSQLRSENPQERAEFARLALQNGQEARRIAEQTQDTYSLWLTLDALGFIYRKQHKYIEAHETQHYRLNLVDSMKVREELFDLYYTLGWTHEAVSDYQAAARWFGRSWRIAQTMESPTMLLNSMIGRMTVWYQWNRWNDALEVANNILQMVEQYQHNEQWILEALEILTLISYRTGENEQGDRYARQLKRLIDQFSNQLSSPIVSPFIQLAREDWTRAIAEFQDKVEHTEPFAAPKVLASLAELVVITGEGADIQQETCERAVTVAEQSGDRKSSAMALRARGRMHLEQQNWSAALADLQQSLQQCIELDIPWEEGQSYYCLGLFYRRRADMLYSSNPTEYNADLGRAHVHFEKALGFFESLNAVNDASRARLALKQDTKAPV
ncbi:MAG TPA: adenylate/guanylate cyclase domain-containing protein [Ktedonobacteraceae bacterium]|nr:adenylate/guanylate cyclase domain-containing protein [Ktedonobacteraceae bacterium]